MKITALGNALVDIMTVLENEEILKKYNLPKGSMTLVDDEFSQRMNTETDNLKKVKASGGSAANTIHGLAKLGVSTSFIGKIGNDRLGNFFYEDMEKAGIHPLLLRSKTNTGRVMAYVSPDSERTMATYLGAAVEMNSREINDEILKETEFLYVEGYLISNHDLFCSAIQQAKQKGIKTCVDLASYNVVEEYLDLLKNDISGHVDLVFANEEEAKALTGLPAHEAVNVISEMCEIAIVKVGPGGSYIKRGDESIHVPAIPVSSLDTTGAGDIYASGFLYGLTRSLSLEQCGRIGTLLASRVIQLMGPKLSSAIWEELIPQINEIVSE